MSKAKKASRTMRSREDNDLFKITYPPYDPQIVSSIQLHLGPGQYLPPGQAFATVHLHKPQVQSLDKQPEDQFSFTLTTYVAGTIQKIGGGFSQGQNVWMLKQGQKKGSLQLINIRQCEHVINNQSITNGNITTKSYIPTSGNICSLCGKKVQLYYQIQEQVITTQTFLNANPDIEACDLKELEWSIILNEQFTPNTSIAKVGDKILNLPFLAKATYLLGQGEKPVNNVIMKIRKVVCKHEKIIENRCQVCLQLIDFSQMQQFTRYLFQYGPNGTGKSLAKNSALLQQQQDYIKKLIDNRRLILILDLDNTILHSNEMNQLQLKDLLKLRDYFLIPKIQQSQEGLKQDYIVVKMRPYLKEFLFLVGRLFQVYIYTKGTRIYADSICRWVRHQWAGQPSPFDINTWSQPNMTFLKSNQCFAPHRIISRNEDMNLETKSMQNILPTRTQYHLILDDRRDVWSNSASWFFTREYYCFFKRKRNPSQMSQSIDHFIEENQNHQPYVAKLIDCYNHMRQHYHQKTDIKVDVTERHDYFLLFAAFALKKIHAFFFDQFKKTQGEKTQNLKEDTPIAEKTKKPKDQRKNIASLSYLQQKTKLFLKGKYVRFFTTPNDESLSTARRALKLGATLLTSKDKEKPDYVIRGNKYMNFVKQWMEDRVKRQQASSKIQLQQQSIKILQEGGSQKKIEQEQANSAQKKQQQKVETQPSKKSKLDVQIQKQIKEPKADYECQLIQLQELYKQGIPIIAETWILASYQFTFKFKFQDFRLHDPFIYDVEHSQFDRCIAKAAEKIKREINMNIEKQLFSQQAQKKVAQGQGPSRNITKRQQAIPQQAILAQIMQAQEEKQEQLQNANIQPQNGDKLRSQ